ncbi:MAG TPA: galactosyldiacylglycerol synthase [Lacunisphaera sp.]
MAKVLILTAGYGEGHNSAARALLEAFNEREDVEAELVDVFALRAPRINNVSRKGYIKLINSAPKIWSWFYRWLDRSPLVPHLFRLLGSHRRLLARIIAEKRPAALVSTYPVYAWLLNQLQREGKVRCPQYTVITDALTINSLWYRARSDAWFVTDPDSATFLIGKGIPATKVHVSGFPVALGFADRPSHWQPPAPKTGTKFRVLFMINSKRSTALKIASELMLHRDWHITITAGRDEQLQRELQTLAAKSPASIEILGWTNRIPELLMTHHVVISKAGGATTQESINALCPLLVSQIVPGQEEGNFELINRNEAGTLAETPEEIVATLQRAFRNEAALWGHWRRNLRRIAQPAAAREITAIILQNAGGATLRFTNPTVSVNFKPLIDKPAAVSP